MKGGLAPKAMLDLAIATFLAAACARLAYWELEARFPLQGPEVVSRAVSSLHAVLVVALCAAAPSLRGGWGVAARALPLGYLAHDAQLLLTRRELYDRGMVVHHACFALLVAVGVGPYPDQARLALFGEAPVPFLNLGWLLHRRRAAGQAAGPGWLFGAVGGVTLSLFVMTRLLVFPRLAAEAALQDECVAFITLAGLAGLNAYWFARLVEVVWKR